jgi:hypothetical protein
VSNSRDSFILLIEWAPEAAHLPNRVGPFETLIDAQQWAKLNIPNGAFEAVPLAYPYLDSGYSIADTALTGDAP